MSSLPSEATASDVPSDACPRHGGPHTASCEQQPPITSPSRPPTHQRLQVMQVIAVPLLLSIMLFVNMMSNTSVVQASPHIAQSTIAPPAPATNTLAQFLSLGNMGKGNHGPFQFPSQVPAALPNNATTPPAPLPSVEPAKMQPLTLALDSSQVAAGIPGVTFARSTVSPKLLTSGAIALVGRSRPGHTHLHLRRRWSCSD